MGYYKPFFFSLIFFFAALASVSFTACYTLKQGTTLIGYLNRAVPLEQSGDEEFIRLVHDIRSFAMEELGLASSKNYTKYVELDRNYLAAVVSASAKDSFTRHLWRFPVVGAMPYKGFFNMEDAQKEKAKLEKKDLDVWISRVTAFSTLGWFEDPIYSYMRSYSTSRLADLLIHELFHATVYLKGHSNFNEELAEFIGTEGARLYMESRFGRDSEEYRQTFLDDEEYQKFLSFVQELIAELETLYSSDIPREEKLRQRETVISRAQEHFELEYDSRFSDDRYRFFSTMSINNAYLGIFRLYHTDDNFYGDLYERSGRDLIAFIEAAKTVKRRGAPPRVQLENALMRLQSSAPEG